MKRKSFAGLLFAALIACYGMGALAIEYTLDDQASEIALIQSALMELDFYYGDVTEHYGARTQRGVRLFQEEYGLEVTGVADDETRALLYEVTGTQPPLLSDMLIELSVTLRPGDSGSAVVWLQESLFTLGHYSGEITGNYGGLTKEAVRLFQRANGLSSDGVAGQNTIRALARAIEAMEREQEGLMQDGMVQDGAMEEATPAKLALGDRHAAVLKLQEDLAELGFYTGEITGSFGRLTKEAVRLFQRANDIPSDGVAGPMTLAEIADEIDDLRRLEAQLANPAPSPTSAPTATVDPYNGLVQLITPAPKVTAAPTATPRPVSGVNSSVGFLNIQRELKLYDSSEEVRQLQIALASLGYYSGENTGYFDFMTRAAVMGYQASKGLSLSGNADKVTLITINDDIFRRYAGVED